MYTTYCYFTTCTPQHARPFATKWLNTNNSVFHIYLKINKINVSEGKERPYRNNYWRYIPRDSKALETYRIKSIIIIIIIKNMAGEGH